MYKNKDDSSLPQKVRNMSDGDRERWVAVYNETYRTCQEEGADDCDGEATKVADSAVSRTFKRSWMGLVKWISQLMEPQASQRSIKDVESWDGSAANYADTDAYCAACLIDVNAAAGRDTKAQDHCMLPVRGPEDDGDTYVKQAIQAAAGGHGISQVEKPDDVPQDAWDAALKAAAGKIVAAYGEMDEEPPDAVSEIAGMSTKEETRRAGFKKLLRAMTIGMVWEAAYAALERFDPQVWINDVYVDEGGQVFLILSSNGKLFRVDATIAAGGVTFGERKQVSLDFPEVAGEGARMRRGSFKIARTAEGRYRWVGVSCSTVLNRVGEIDSSKLFDSFIQRIADGHPYPIRVFYHQGEQFRTGQADYVARDGHLLITSGLYDDTELAQMEIQARLKEPDYWGDSIGYLYQGAPEMLRVADDIEVPVYNDGILVEISTAPESQVAAWFTNQDLKEVDRMLTGPAWESFVKLWDGDEDAAKKWLEKNVDEANRSIIDAGMLARSKSAHTQHSAGGASAPAVPAPAPAPQELLIDDSTIALIAERVGAGAEALIKPVSDQLSGILERLGKLETAGADTRARLEILEADEDDAALTRQIDMPRRSPIKVTYRPRIVNPPDEGEGEDVDPDMSAQAEKALGALKVKY